MRIVKKESPREAQEMIRRQYLDDEELKELGLEKNVRDEEAYEMVGAYCLLQKIRRGELINV